MYRRIFLLGGTAMVAGANTEQKASVSKVDNRIICRVAVNSTEIALDSNLEITCFLECLKGPVQIYVPFSWGYRGFEVELIGPDKTQYVPPINNFHLPPLEMIKSPENNISMYEGMVMGEKRQFAARDLFPHRGVYTLLTGYVSPVPAEYALSKSVLVYEDGVIPSKPIQIKVT